MSVIDTFVNRYKLRSEFTVKNYRSTLNQFFTCIKKNPETYFENKNIDAYKKDITTYYNSIAKMAHKSRDAKLFTVKSFFVKNGVDIPKLFWEDLREQTLSTGAITQDQIPTVKDLQKILQHANIRERAWILMAVSSGMRIGEIIRITIKDVKFEENPVRIFLPASVAGRLRDTFISEEAKDALIQWLNVRDDFLEKTKNFNNYSHKKKNINNDLVFPVAYVTLVTVWKRLLMKSNLYEIDEQTKWTRMHIHTLRKYAITTMLLNKMPAPLVNYIVGHKVYLGGEYEKYHDMIPLVAKEYKQIEPFLCIFTRPVFQDRKQIEEEIREKVKAEYEGQFREFDRRITELFQKQLALERGIH
jgi:integrase